MLRSLISSINDLASTVSLLLDYLTGHQNKSLPYYKALTQLMAVRRSSACVALKWDGENGEVSDLIGLLRTIASGSGSSDFKCNFMALGGGEIS